MKGLVCLGLAVCLLAGLCACGQDVVEETTAEATTTEVVRATELTTAEPTREPFEHTVVQRIHKSLPEFSFVLRGDVKRIDGWPDMEYADIRSVEINDPNGKFHQLFDEFDVEEEIPFGYDHHAMLSLADYDSDGYLDLRLQFYADRNSSCSFFWLWDITQQCFVKNEQLQNLSYGCNLFIDDDGNLRGFNTAGLGIGWGYTIYHFVDGEFIETEARSWLVEPDGVYVSTYQIVDGEMQLISREPEEFQ